MANEVLAAMQKEAEKQEEQFQLSRENAWYEMYRSYCFLFQSNIEFLDFQEQMMNQFEE